MITGVKHRIISIRKLAKLTQQKCCHLKEQSTRLKVKKYAVNRYLLLKKPQLCMIYAPITHKVHKMKFQYTL